MSTEGIKKAWEHLRVVLKRVYIYIWNELKWKEKSILRIVNSQRRNCKRPERRKSTIAWYGLEGWNAPRIYMGLQLVLLIQCKLQ